MFRLYEKIVILRENVRTLQDALNFMNLTSVPNAEDLKRIWKTLAIKYHPDRGGRLEDMQSLNQAKDILDSVIKGTYREPFNRGGSSSNSSNSYTDYARQQQRAREEQARREREARNKENKVKWEQEKDKLIPMLESIKRYIINENTIYDHLIKNYTLEKSNIDAFTIKEVSNEYEFGYYVHSFYVNMILNETKVLVVFLQIMFKDSAPMFRNSISTNLRRRLKTIHENGWAPINKLTIESLFPKDILISKVKLKPTESKTRKPRTPKDKTGTSENNQSNELKALYNNLLNLFSERNIKSHLQATSQFDSKDVYSNVTTYPNIRNNILYFTVNILYKSEKLKHGKLNISMEFEFYKSENDLWNYNILLYYIDLNIKDFNKSHVTLINSKHNIISSTMLSDLLSKKMLDHIVEYKQDDSSKLKNELKIRFETIKNQVLSDSNIRRHITKLFDFIEPLDIKIKKDSDTSMGFEYEKHLNCSISIDNEYLKNNPINIYFEFKVYIDSENKIVCENSIYLNGENKTSTISNYYASELDIHHVLPEKELSKIIKFKEPEKEEPKQKSRNKKAYTDLSQVSDIIKSKIKDVIITKKKTPKGQEYFETIWNLKDRLAYTVVKFYKSMENDSIIMYNLTNYLYETPRAVVNITIENKNKMNGYNIQYSVDDKFIYELIKTVTNLRKFIKDFTNPEDVKEIILYSFKVFHEKNTKYKIKGNY